MLVMAWEGDCHLDNSCSAYFLDCIPGDLELHQAISDIDERLKKNAICIEETVKELQSDFDKLSADQKLQNTDSLQWLNSSNTSSTKLFTTPRNQLTEFLKALLHFLKTEKGLEEMIFQLLLELSDECGVVFPLTSCGASFHLPSTTSIHAVEDSGFLDALSLWDDVRLYLRRFIFDKLQNCQEITDMLTAFQLKTQCLRQLLFLYPETEIITRYQNIQFQSVQDLLQNKVLINGNEISFEKMVHGFENIIPSLLNMMRQDLYALRTLVEESKVLKFINETYLQNIASELYILIDKFCEQQLKKNALHSTKLHGTKANKCLNKQKGTVHSVGVLKKATTNSDIPSDMNKTSTQDEQLLPVNECVSLECSWRNAFKGLAHSAAHSVKTVIEDACSNCLQQEANLYSSGKSLAMCTQSVETTCNEWMEKEQPKKVAKFCSDIMIEIDMLLPLALASSENFLRDNRKNFVDSCSKVAADVLFRLEERSKDVPHKVPVQNMYIILSTAILVHNLLTKYENVLKETSQRSLFLIPIQQYQEFIRIIQFQITSYNIRICATNILQDAQSHHWEDSKSFYEGERCSFSVQMWHYHCCALRCDLWTVVPSKVAQQLLAEVLSETLAILASRYSQCHPTYKRMALIRIDITAILLCTENLLWSVCHSAKELFQPLEDVPHWILNIHNHCNALLAVLAVLTSPLDKLYEVFCDGFCEYSSEPQLKPVNSGLLEWLHWIQPSFSYESPSSPSCDKISVQQHLALLLAQPSCDLNLLLQILVFHDCLVPRILLNNSSIDQENFYDKYVKEKDSDQQAALIEAIVMVITHCKLLPRGLGVVLEDYMEKHQLQNKLCSLSVEDESVVPRCLHLFVSKAIKETLRHVISLLHMWQALENSGKCLKQVLPENLLSKIPKEWDYMPREFKRREYRKNFTKLAAHVFSVLIDNLPAMISSLPSTIKYLFTLVQRKFPNNIPELRNSYLLWHVITIICRTLEDGNAMELLSGVTIDRWTKEKLELMSDCLLSIVGQQKDNPKPVIQKVINCLEKQRPKWIEVQLQNAKQFCSESAFLTDEGSNAQQKCSWAELTEQKIHLMLLDICHQPGGNEYLRQIYHIIQLNEDWLKEQIYSHGFPHESMTTQRPSHLVLHGVRQHLMFNPLHIFNHIGSMNFNQSTITEWNWDWSKVLHSNPGLSQLTFRTLLANRWEMQADSSLEAEEKDMVDHLQKKYFTENKEI
ncbi:uncharacterized protein KIAA0825 homolog isoform X3 [Hypanus sabinus]|uniref:uncharacterized protein KIAA0825 homolog isoform X3 n=1 Tax=Hypanus sabinus TaxID=79690 RepID=UPI0028C506FE|nr:uncharacterized protein KIAA0825 homolog isoform X3 [Hypanus sabinus]